MALLFLSVADISGRDSEMEPFVVRGMSPILRILYLPPKNKSLLKLPAFWHPGDHLGSIKNAIRKSWLSQVFGWVLRRHFGRQRAENRDRVYTAIVVHI